MRARKQPTDAERNTETIRGFLSDREIANTNRRGKPLLCITCDTPIPSPDHRCTNRRCLPCHHKRCDHGN